MLENNFIPACFAADYDSLPPLGWNGDESNFLVGQVGIGIKLMGMGVISVPVQLSSSFDMCAE